MKRILIVTREFLPSASVAVKRPLGLARHVLDCGWTPFVLTAHPRCQRLVDYSQEQDIRTISHIERVRCWSLWEHSKNWRDARPAWRYVLTWMRRVVAKATEELIPIDLAYPWAIAATKVGVSMVRRFGIDLIWSTQPPLTSLYLARRISQRTGVPYVVDYRDAKPPARNGQTSLRDGRYMLAERELLRDAAGLIYSAPAHEAILVEKYPFVTQLPRCLAYTGFDASETNVLPPYVFTRPTILHGGSLYGGQRRLDGFLKALEMLRHHGSTNNQTVTVLYNTVGGTRTRCTSPA